MLTTARALHRDFRGGFPEEMQVETAQKRCYDKVFLYLNVEVEAVMVPLSRKLINAKTRLPSHVSLLGTPRATNSTNL